MERTQLQMDRKQIGDMLRTLHKLRHRKDHCGSTYNTQALRYHTLNKEVTMAIELYARHACLDLCERLRTKLPREVRDMIYEHMIEASTIYVDKLAVDWGFYIADPQVPNLTFIGAGLHYWDPAFVGLDFMSELAQTWYRVHTFEFSHDLENMSRFLAEDRWGLGLRPQELVSKVSLCFSPGVTGGFSDQSLGVIGRFPDQSLDRLNLLLEWKHGSHISVNIIVRPYFRVYGDDLRLMREFPDLRSLFTSLKALKHVDYRISGSVDRVCPVGEKPEFSGDGLFKMLWDRVLPLDPEEKKRLRIGG